MKLITTLYSSYLTGSEVADAVMEYGLALSRRRDVDMVSIPIVDDDGTPRRAQFTIGWQSDIGSITQEGHGDEILDPVTVADLHSKARGANGGEPFADLELEKGLWPSFD